MREVTLDQVITDAERFIHKTAYILQRNSDVLTTREELIGDGYVVLADFLQNYWDGKTKFPFYYFGKRLWFVLKKRVQKGKLRLDIDISGTFEDHRAADLFYYIGVKHMMEMLPAKQRRVVRLYMEPTPHLLKFAEANGMRPFPSLKLLARYCKVAKESVREYLEDFHEKVKSDCSFPEELSFHGRVLHINIVEG